MRADRGGVPAATREPIVHLRAAKELAVGETVRFHKAKSFKIRGLAGKVTAYPAEKAAREVEADAAP